MTTSLLPPKWNSPHIIMDGTTLPSVCYTQASIYLSPSRLRTRIRPSLRYSLKQDSSEKTQYFHWWRSQSCCHRACCWQRRRCWPVSLGHLAGLREGYPAVKIVDWWFGPTFDVQSDEWTPPLTRNLNGTGCSAPLSTEPGLLVHLSIFDDVREVFG